ncbi:tryptorubin family RiPP precursor [Streptomyces sp. NPDC018029]
MGPTESTGGTHMKVVRSLKKKITGEKSLKAYAWYHWY